MSLKKNAPFLRYAAALKRWLAGLSPRTGLVVLTCCIPLYLLSFAQMALPIGLEWKGILWATFFGMAKTAQYAGLAILGKEGAKQVAAGSKRLFRRLRGKR